MNKLENDNQLLCVLSDDYPSPGRPVYVFVEQLVNALVDLGVRVEVIAPQSVVRSALRHVPMLKVRELYSTSRGNLYYVNRPKVYTFGRYRFFSSLFSIINQRRLTKILYRIRPSVLYGHFWNNALKMLDYSKTTKTPLFVACGEGDNALEELNKKLKDDRRKELSSIVKGIICVSSENKRKCVDYHLSEESKIIVLPNCVDDTLFRPNNSINRKEFLGIDESDFVIAFVGAFIKRKGSMALSDAVELLNDNDIKVIFIGRPLDGEDFSPKCKGIVFKGLLHHDLIPDYLNCANVFVLPTLKEGCSNAIVEALACGVPVISSNRAFNDDILDCENSLKVDPENVSEIANAIQKLKCNKDLYCRLKDNAVRNSGNFSIVTRARKVKEFIESRI